MPTHTKISQKEKKDLVYKPCETKFTFLLVMNLGYFLNNQYRELECVCIRPNMKSEGSETKSWG